LAADKLMDFLEQQRLERRPLPNVGALARARLPKKLPLSKLKPLLVVRTPPEFYREYVLWCSLYLASFWLVHIVWRRRRFRGDPAILPALQLLTGIGLTLAVSLRDPLRDTLEFRKFAWGAALGCCLLLLPLLRLFQYQRYARWTYTPLLAAFGLFVLLLAAGSGPTGSDAKVNLGPFQPVEAIKILLVLFLAGYFANKWEWLRELREKRFLLRWLPIPRLDHSLPVMVGVAGALALFFVLKDMGPALVIGLLFLTMFAVARNRSGLALLGVAALVVGVAIGCHYGKPETVVDRVSMWLSPWDNDVRGGDQLAHALWAFSTGGVWGSGPGWGDPGLIPAGHTDLVLPAIGEEWGFAGVFTIGLLFVFLVRRAFRIALHAPDEFSLFLALGLGTLIAFEMLLISGGVLGAIPLSGVVSPFLSSGNTAMLANFLIFAILLAISNQPVRIVDGESFRPMFLRPVRAVSLVLAGCAAVLVGKAAYYQVLHDQEFLIHDSQVIEEDGVKRPQYNPRLSSLARQIPRGGIYDRNGLPLATSNWDELEHYRAEYAKLGVEIDRACTRIESRHYPFGAAAAHVVGDLRTGEGFHASNASLVEHDSNEKLQGYEDIHDLGPLVRYRHQLLYPGMQALLKRDRSIRTSIDIALQVRMDALLRKRLEAGGKKGAAVVMNPGTGDILAMVSYPPADSLDRARYGQYPPGSTFKLVTAIAALRLDPDLANKKYVCRRMSDGRAGNVVNGWNRPIRDDVGDSAHGTLSMARALMVSCNAYFAQLGTYDVGAKSLHQTAELLDIPAGEIPEIKKMMPFAAYGQGPVLVTPFKMARVAATIAAGGAMPQGRWILDDSNQREDPPRRVLPAEQAAFLATAMRSVVTGGTARRAMAGVKFDVAGKTGTAQVGEGDPHSWFAGFAPFGAEPSKQIAFAVVVEHGGYGAQLAAPIAREIVEAALGPAER
jgi:cell division protein FtsI/penicillin-binding protein 2/cell division protein FtsW (lipid II flippase)